MTNPLHGATGGTGFDDDVLGKNLRNQIRAEILANQVTDPSCTVTVIKRNGTVIQKSEGLIAPSTDQLDYARAVSEALHRNVEFGGSWIVVWAEPRPITREPSRFMLLWKDADGDVPLATDCVERFEVLEQKFPPEVWCARAALRWKAYQEWLTGIEVTPGQMIRAAKGQRSTDPRSSVPGSTL